MAETSNRAGEKGTIVQIIGAVVDVEFPEGHIPELYDALQVKGDGKNRPDLVLEVQQQIGGGVVRCIAMGSSVIIGHEIGAGHRERAQEYADHLIYLAGAIGLFAAVLTQIIAPLITSFFDVSAQAKETAFILKDAASICVFFLSMQFTICKGILRGGGQAAAFTKVGLLSCWLINIPAGFVTALVLHANPFWIYL